MSYNAFRVSLQRQVRAGQRAVLVGVSASKMRELRRGLLNSGGVFVLVSFVGLKQALCVILRGLLAGRRALGWGGGWLILFEIQRSWDFSR